MVNQLAEIGSPPILGKDLLWDLPASGTGFHARRQSGSPFWKNTLRCNGLACQVLDLFRNSCDRDYLVGDSILVSARTTFFETREEIWPRGAPAGSDWAALSSTP